MHPYWTASLNRPHRKDNFTKCHVYHTIRFCEAPLFVAFRTNSGAIRLYKAPCQPDRRSHAHNPLWVLNLGV